jgi:hypothetical protein
MSHLHKRAVGAWIHDAMTIAVLIAILLAAWFILDLGAAVRAFGKTVPEYSAARIANPSTEALAKTRADDLSVLLSNWEMTVHCSAPDGCANCAGTGGNSCKTTTYNCPTYTYFFPQCCGTFNCATNTFSGTNTCGQGGQPAACTTCCSPN